MTDMADAPGGGSLAFTARSLQIIDVIEGNRPGRTGWGSARRGRRIDRERMNVARQEVIDGGVDQAVARHAAQAAKRLGHDSDAKMAVALRSSRMAGMPVTLVLDDEERRRKTALQTLPQTLFTGAWLGHDSAFPACGA